MQKADAIDKRIKAHEITIQEIVNLQKGSRIMSIKRERYDSPVIIETSNSVYEITDDGEDKFACKLWDKLMSVINEYGDKLSDELNNLNTEFDNI